MEAHDEYVVINNRMVKRNDILDADASTCRVMYIEPDTRRIVVEEVDCPGRSGEHRGGGVNRSKPRAII